MAHSQQLRARGLFLGVDLTRQRHGGESVLIRRGVRLDCGNIRAVPGETFLRLSKRLGECLADGILQRVPLAEVAAFQQLQLRHFNIQIHFLFNERVAAGQRLDLRIGECLFVHILSAAYWRLAGHDLRDEFLFSLYQLIEIGVECTLGDVTVNVHLGIFVALPDDAPLPLLEICGPPWTIQMVQCHQLLLAVGSGTHALGAAQQHPHLTGAHLGEQVFFLRLRLSVMDIGDLVFRHAHFHQLTADVIINAENAFTLGCGQVTENHLRGVLFRRAPPDVKYCLRALDRFALRVGGQHGIDEPLVQCQLPAIVGDQQHVVHAAVHLLVAYLLGTLRQ